MSEELDLDIKTKIKMIVDTEIVRIPGNEKVELSKHEDKNSSPKPGGVVNTPNKRRGYIKNGSKLVPYAVLYSVGLSIFLLLIALDIFSWNWGAKLFIFTVASAASFLSSAWKGFLTNASDDELDYTPQQIERKKSYCDGIIIIGALIAILAGFSGLISGHKLEQRVEDLEASKIRTETAMCDIYRAAGQNCPFRQRERKQPNKEVWNF